jgi:hypothetical protein
LYFQFTQHFDHKNLINHLEIFFIAQSHNFIIFFLLTCNLFYIFILSKNSVDKLMYFRKCFKVRYFKYFLFEFEFYFVNLLIFTFHLKLYILFPSRRNNMDWVRKSAHKLIYIYLIDKEH